jgi:histidinol-phosphate aminotransferase
MVAHFKIKMKKNWIKNIIRIQPDNIDRSKFLRLDKNERVIDFDKKFLSYMKKSINTYQVAAYPDVNKIYKSISKELKIPKNNICLTAGSDIALKMCFEYFTTNGDKIITLEPTFGMVDVYAKIYNLKNIKIHYDRNLNLKLNELLSKIKKDISLIIIANPNSPTGTIIKHEDLKKIIIKSHYYKIPLVIDEAYFGFYNFSYIKFIKKYKNIIITRTFSKAFGLAGLRVGFLVSDSAISRNLYKYRPMYEINNIACLAIGFLLKNKEIVKNHIRNLLIGKSFLIEELKKFKIKYIDTHANFFHIYLGSKKKYFERILKKNKILVRKGPGVEGYENYLRVSLGSKNQMEKIVILLKKVLA